MFVCAWFEIGQSLWLHICIQRSTEPQRSKNGFGKADIVSLEPYTNYIIKVRGRLHGKFSATAAEQQFQTLQEGMKLY